jgi:hypothetical protein
VDVLALLIEHLLNRRLKGNISFADRNTDRITKRNHLESNGRDGLDGEVNRGPLREISRERPPRNRQVDIAFG